MPIVNGPVDWDKLRVVVFDVDGTLYDQRRLRLFMLWQLLASLARSGSARHIRALQAFRSCREELGDAGDAPFVAEQYRVAALRCGVPPGEMEDLVGDWMERRPLQFLPRCRYPGVDRVFEALRKRDIQIAVFSDYPASAKLAAMGLEADLVVAACDPDVERLKPNPRGLQKILRFTGAEASRCLMIGDRFDRDGEVASRIGVRALIRAPRPHPSIDTFRSYEDVPFSSLKIA